jgi:hypothetical protein
MQTDVVSIVIIILVVVILVWALFKLQRNAINPPKLRVAMELISSVNDDLKMATQKKTDPNNNKKFNTGKWEAYQRHLDFIDKDSVESLQTAFKQMAEYNRMIDATSVTDAAPGGFAMDAVLEPLSKGRVGLAKWIQDNIAKESTRGFFGFK